MNPFSDLTPGGSNYGGFSDLVPGQKQAPQASPAQPQQSLADQIWGGLAGVGHAVGSVVGGNAIGQDIGTLGGYGVSLAKDTLNKGINAVNSKVNPAAPKLATTQAQNYDLSAPSPLQAVGDAAKIGATVGGLSLGAPVSVGAAALQGGAMGALGGAGQAALGTSGKAIPTGQDLAQVGTGAALGGAVGSGTGAAVQGLSGLLRSTGNKITESVIKPSKADYADGFNVGTIQKYGLGGSLPTMLDKTHAQLADLTNQLNDKLAGSNTAVDINDVVKQTEAALSKNSLKSFGSNTSMQGAVDQLKNEVGTVAGDMGHLSVPDAQIVKQASGQYGAWQFGKIDPESTARETVYNTFYNKLKTAIEDASPEGVKAINKQISELIPVSNAIVRRIPVASRNNLFSLGDLVSLGASAVNPHALGLTLANLASKSGAVGDLLSRFAPKLGSIATPAASELGQVAGSTTGDQESPPTQ